MYISLTRGSKVIIIQIYVLALNSTLQYLYINNSNYKIYLLMMILWDIKEYCWPELYVSEPRGNKVIINQIYLLASNTGCLYGPTNTSNSKTHPLVIILSHNGEEQEDIAIPSWFQYQNNILRSPVVDYCYSMYN